MTSGARQCLGYSLPAQKVTRELGPNADIQPAFRKGNDTFYTCAEITRIPPTVATSVQHDSLHRTDRIYKWPTGSK